MNTLAAIRSGTIGVAAVAVPAGALFGGLGYAQSNTLIGLVPYIAALVVVLAIVGALAWACVRVARFPPRIAIGLTTLPFFVLTLAAVPSLADHTILPLLFWIVQLAIALFVAQAAIHMAKR